jgi:hypothetical protein
VIEVRLVSPEGQTTDTLGPFWGGLPFLNRVSENELLLAWSSSDAGVFETMLWFNESGVVRHEQTVPLDEAEALFAYTLENEVVLVTHPVTYDWDSLRHGLLLHTYDPEGSPLSVDTLFRESLPHTGFVGQSAFARRGDELIAGFITGENGPSPTHRFRVVRHWPDSTRVGYPYSCQFPAGSYVNLLDLSAGDVSWPEECELVTFGVFRSDMAEIHYKIVAGESLPGDEHVQRLTPPQSLSGISSVWLGATIYGAYTANNLTDPQQGGAYVLAFPADEIYAGVAPRFSPPRAFSLTVYPNPFNSATRISYSLERDGLVLLEVYDLTGRLTDRRFFNRQSAGDHTIVWNAADLPSGLYFARVQAAEYSAVAKLFLMR